MSFLICVDHSLQRLVKNNFEGYKINFSWFQEIDFKGVMAQTIEAPFLPKVDEAGDDTNFEEYDNEETFRRSTAKPKYQRQFKDF